MSTWTERLPESATLDYADNEPGAIEKLHELNEFYRRNRWPKEYSKTTHQLFCADARHLSSVGDESVHLVVTSPPYWTLKEYAPHDQQLGAIADYENFLSELDKVWSECARVLVPGGRICCVVGDVCIPSRLRKNGLRDLDSLHSQ
jgi:modification methylase